MADQWIEIARSSITAFYNIYGTRWLEEMGGRIAELGAEAPKLMVENYQFQKRKLENNRKLIEELNKIKDRLEKGSTEKLPHEDLSLEEERMIELINTLH